MRLIPVFVVLYFGGGPPMWAALGVWSLKTLGRRLNRRLDGWTPKFAVER